MTSIMNIPANYAIGSLAFGCAVLWYDGEYVGSFLSWEEAEQAAREHYAQADK